MGEGAGLGISVSAQDGRVVVALAGDLDAAASPQVRQCLGTLAEMGARQVVLDLAAVGVMDSTGLSTLVGGLRRLRDRGGDLVLASPSAGVRRVLAIASLTSLFTIRGSVLPPAPPLSESTPPAPG